MPIYEYLCPRCEAGFELIRPISQASEPAPCPRCGTKSDKLPSVFASKVDHYIKVPGKEALRKHTKKGKK